MDKTCFVGDIYVFNVKPDYGGVLRLEINAEGPIKVNLALKPRDRIALKELIAEAEKEHSDPI